MTDFVITKTETILVQAKDKLDVLSLYEAGGGETYSVDTEIDEAEGRRVGR